MARLDAQQAIAIVAIQQLVHDWANDLDMSAGRGIAELVTDDCVYAVGGQVRRGRTDVVRFYEDRHARLVATPDGLPTLRHPTSNLRVSFEGADAATIRFTLIFFTGTGPAPLPADVAAVSDVVMTCRREADGHWRIASFDSVQQFRRSAS